MMCGFPAAWEGSESLKFGICPQIPNKWSCSTRQAGGLVMFRADVGCAWFGVPDAGSSETLSLSEQVQQHPVLSPWSQQCCGAPGCTHQPSWAVKQARCKALPNGHKACLVLTASFKALLTKCPGGKCQFSRAGPCPALWTARTSIARRYLLQKDVSEKSSLPTLTFPWQQMEHLS